MAKQKRGALIFSPSILFIYAEQKIGKTYACTRLEGAELWDFQNGADAYEDAFIENITSYDDMIRAVETNKVSKQFKIVVIDTLLDMNRMLSKFAVKMYKESLTGKDLESAKKETWYTETEKLDPNLVLQLIGFNKGEEARYEALVKFVKYLRTSYEKIVFIAHNKLNNNTLAEKGVMVVKEIDLTNKIKEYVLRYADQICMATRDNDTQVYVDFSQKGGGGDANKLGGRFDYLEGKKFVLSEKDATGEIHTFWHRIFPDIYGITAEDVKKEIQELEEKEKADLALLS